MLFKDYHIDNHYSNRKLYWTTRDSAVEDGDRNIRVSELNGTNVAVLLNEEFTSSPRAIVVHPGKG